MNHRRSWWRVLSVWGVPIIFLSVVLSHNHAALRTYHHAAADFGADALQIMRASQFKEALGPYSRFRWHHPGPLHFYALALLQWTCPPGLYGHGAHMFAQVLLNAAFAAWIGVLCVEIVAANAPSGLVDAAVAPVVLKDVDLGPIRVRELAPPMMKPPAVIRHDSSDRFFASFWRAEKDFRWTRGHASAIEFSLGDVSARPLAIEIEASGWGASQRVRLSFNGMDLGWCEFGSGVKRVELMVPAAAVRKRDQNVLALDLHIVTRGHIHDDVDHSTAGRPEDLRSDLDEISRDRTGG